MMPKITTKNVFLTTKQGMMKQSGETLSSAVCISIKRCHVSIPSSYYTYICFSLENKEMVSFTVLLLSCFGYLGETWLETSAHFVPFTQMAHSSVVHITMGSLPNLKRLTSNILKCQ